MDKMQTEIKTKLNLKTGREEQVCSIIVGGKVVYTYKTEIVNGKVNFLK